MKPVRKRREAAGEPSEPHGSAWERTGCVPCEARESCVLPAEVLQSSTSTSRDHRQTVCGLSEIRDQCHTVIGAWWLRVLGLNAYT